MCIARAFLDRTKNDRCLAVAHGRTMRADFPKERGQLEGQTLRAHRRRLVLVDHTSCGRFERRRHRTCRLRDVVVNEPIEALWRMPCDRCVKEEKQLVLPLSQMLNGWQEDSDVDFLLTPDDRRGMFSRAGEMRTGIWTGDLDEPLRAAAD